VGDDFPDDLTVNAEVLVHDPVAEPDEKGPFNVATSIAGRERNSSLPMPEAVGPRAGP
jgi:hypothetical protein